MASVNTSSGRIPLRRSQAVLRRLACKREGCTFSHLRTIEQGLTASSLSRLLKAMQAENMVAKDEQTGLYHLHEEFIRLARETVGMVPPHERLQPLITALAHSTGESAAWFECIPTGAVLMAKTEMANGFHYMDVGRDIIGNPLGHGVGQVLMAFLPEAEVCDRLQRLGPLPIAKQDYRRRLNEIWQGQVILNDLRMHGIAPFTRMARPVFRGDGGALIGVLLITVLPTAATAPHQERMAEAVVSSAARATELLAGGNQPVRELAVTECPHSKAIRWGKWRFVHQPETFGADVGELHDSEADPEEMRNLYHAAECRETVEQCRRQLLEWLIRTTRIRTGWGVQGVDHKNKLYPDAGDGRMPLPKFGPCRNYE